MQPLSEEAVRQGRPPFRGAMGGAIRGRIWLVPSNPGCLSFESLRLRVNEAFAGSHEDARLSQVRV